MLVTIPVSLRTGSPERQANLRYAPWIIYLIPYQSLSPTCCSESDLTIHNVGPIAGAACLSMNNECLEYLSIEPRGVGMETIRFRDNEEHNGERVHGPPWYYPSMLVSSVDKNP